MNTYTILKAKHEKEFNDFPMMFAFSNQQFGEGMKKLELEPSDTDKIYKFGGSGGYYKRTDSERLSTMLNSHDAEMKEAMNDEQFIFDMFDYELANHEYNYTYDVSDTLSALGLTMDEVNNNPKLLEGLKKAKASQFEKDKE